MMESAFRSSNRLVIEAFEAYETKRQETNDARMAFAQKYGATGVMVRRAGFGHGDFVLGLPGDEDPEDSPGWRYSPKAGHLVPNLRRAIGKSIATEMADLRDDGPDLPGMPPFHLSGLHVNAPALFRHEDAIYAGWGCEMPVFYSIDDRNGDKVDLTLWDQIKASQYYVGLETYEAERKSVDV